MPEQECPHCGNDLAHDAHVTRRCVLDQIGQGLLVNAISRGIARYLGIRRLGGLVLDCAQSPHLGQDVAKPVSEKLAQAVVDADLVQEHALGVVAQVVGHQIDLAGRRVGHAAHAAIRVLQARRKVRVRLDDGQDVTHRLAAARVQQGIDFRLNTIDSCGNLLCSLRSEREIRITPIGLRCGLCRCLRCLTLGFQLPLDLTSAVDHRFDINTRLILTRQARSEIRNFFPRLLDIVAGVFYAIFEFRKRLLCIIDKANRTRCVDVRIVRIIEIEIKRR